MTTDFSKPLVTDAYATLLPAIQAAISDQVRQFDPTLTGTSTNIPTGAKRLNETTGWWERFNGTSWVIYSMTGTFSGITNGSGQIIQNATLAAGAFGLSVVGAAGAARDIAVFGQSGFSNGFTVRYTGSAMAYSFDNGNVAISGGNLAVTGALSATGVIKSDGTNNYVQIKDTSGTADWWLMGSTGGTTKLFRIYDNTASADRLVIDAAGNAGIGLTPSAWSSYKHIDVGTYNGIYGSPSLSNEIGLFTNAAYNSGWKYLVTGQAATWGYQYQGGYFWNTAPSGTANNPITFTQTMALDANGNLGIGVTPVIWVGASGSNGKSLQGDSWIIGSVAGTDQTNLATNAYRDAYTSTWKYRVTSTAQYYDQGNGHSFFSAPSGTAGTAASFTRIFNVDKGKALTLEGATSTAGTGIAFPATQLASTDPNTLDDYEEGTWTPSVGGNATYTQQLGTYTKVGRLVTFNLLMVINVLGTGSSITISGLPFTTSNNNAAANIASISGSVFAFTGIWSMIIASGTSLSLTSTASATANTGPGNAIFTNGTSITMSGFFYTT